MRRMPWLPLAIVTALCSPAAAQVGGGVRDRLQPSAVQSGTASITGRVIAADSGRPLRLARVTATAPELNNGRITTTDENGAFELSNLPAGHYTVSASKTGYITVNFGQRRPLRAGRPFEVRDGLRVRDIDFRLPHGAAVTGRVTDQDGEPLVGATVRALRYRFTQGERRLMPGGNAQTDDRGVFRMYGLQPGTYFVSATAQVASIGEMRVVTTTSAGTIEASSFTSDSAPVTYEPTYYPGVPALSDAAPINVPIGEEVSGIDFMLQLVTASRVSGIIVGSSGAAAGATVMLVPDDSRGMTGQAYSGRVGRDGSFTIQNVPPGRYIAVARSGGGRGGGQQQDAYATMPVFVSGPVVTGVNLALMPGMTISGTVSFEGASQPAAQDLSRVRVNLWTPMSASLPTIGGQLNAAPRQDGSFTIPNVPAGSRMFRVANLPPSWTLKGIYLDGRDVSDELVDLKPGENAGHVVVVLTDKATVISGSAVDEHDQPLQNYTAIAFPVDSNLWRPMSRFIQAARANKDGTYTIRGLPPGEYLVCAVDDVDQGEWYDPDLLQQLRFGASRVLLQEADNKTQNLKIVVSQ